MYYFIVNPNSRSGKGALIWKGLEGILNERNVEYKTFFTEYRGHAVLLSESITSYAAPENPVTLIAVGGDGTIKRCTRSVIYHFRLYSHRIRKRFLPRNETSGRTR